MDDRSFDDLARALAPTAPASGTRRTAFGLALGSLLAALGLADGKNKKGKGNGKGNGRDRGKGDGKGRGKGKGNGKGKGRGKGNGKGNDSPPPPPPPPPDPCAGVSCPTCQVCRAGACVLAANDAVCVSDEFCPFDPCYGRCLRGICNAPPSFCTRAGGRCSGGADTLCCSRSCAPILNVCNPGGLNVRCYDTSDCNSSVGLGCVGYRCKGFAGAACTTGDDCAFNSCRDGACF